MKYQLQASVQQEIIIFTNGYDYNALRKQLNGKELLVTFEEANKMTDKEKMYAYIHKAIIPAMVKALTDCGWSGIDNIIAEEHLKDRFAKEVIYNVKTNEEMYFRKSKADMNKARLLKFIQDCLFYLENTFNVQVADGNTWKIEQETQFTLLKTLKK